MRGFLKSVEETRLREHEERMSAPPKQSAPVVATTPGYEKTGRKPGAPVPQSKLDEIHVALCRDLAEQEKAGKKQLSRSHLNFAIQFHVSASIVKRVHDAIRKGQRALEREPGRIAALRDALQRSEQRLAEAEKTMGVASGEAEA